MLRGISTISSIYSASCFAFQTGNNFCYRGLALNGRGNIMRHRQAPDLSDVVNRNNVCF